MAQLYGACSSGVSFVHKQSSRLGRMRRVAGIDVGGTFTDLLIHEAGPDGARSASRRVPTSAGNQAQGVLDALEAAGVSPADIDLVIHGTTTTTNAVLERKAARVGLITTRGLPRHPRARPPHPAEALRPDRHLRAADPARAAARGRRAHERPRRGRDAARRGRGREARRSGSLPPGCESARHPLPAFLRQPGARAPRRARSRRATWPNAYVTLGHALLSEFREYERGTTASVNAAVQPILDRYVGRLRARARGARL